MVWWLWLRVRREDYVHTSSAAVLRFNLGVGNWDALHNGLASIFVLVNRESHTLTQSLPTTGKKKKKKKTHNRLTSRRVQARATAFALQARPKNCRCVVQMGAAPF